MQGRQHDYQDIVIFIVGLLALALALVAAARLEAIAAVDRFVAAWNEGHERFLATLGAGCRMHLPVRSASAAVTGSTASALSRCFARRAAVGASTRLVREAFLSEKLLFTTGKRKGLAAVGTG